MTPLNFEDEARLQYSRILWKNPRTRKRLLHVWEHPEHPHRERFEENRELVVGFLECDDPQVYVDSVAGSGKWSLRTLTREIPCVIWSLWDESAAVTGSDSSMSAGRVELISDGRRPPLH
jgi:hypothetical protein